MIFTLIKGRKVKKLIFIFRLTSPPNGATVIKYTQEKVQKIKMKKQIINLITLLGLELLLLKCAVPSCG